MNIPDFKIKVTPDQNKTVQETLFKYKVYWATSLNKLEDISKRYLFIRSGLITYGENPEYFERQSLPELTFKEFENLYIKETMETKTLSIQIPEGFEIDKERSTFEKIVFKELPKKPVRITKWEDFKDIHGWRLDDACVAWETSYIPEVPTTKKMWPTKELAEASLALCQLIRYRNNWNEGWVADWTDTTDKYCVTVRSSKKVEIELWNNCNKILSFKNSIIAQEFLKTFKDLIEIAKPLL